MHQIKLLSWHFKYKLFHISFERKMRDNIDDDVPRKVP